MYERIAFHLDSVYSMYTLVLIPLCILLLQICIAQQEEQNLKIFC